MKFFYAAIIKAVVELTDEDFNYLWQSCDKHYDGAVESMVKPGSPMWGSSNRRHWHRQDPDKIEQDLTVELTSRHLQLLIKSLELHSTPQAGRLYITLTRIWSKLGAKALALNEQYAKQILNAKV